MRPQRVILAVVIWLVFTAAVLFMVGGRNRDLDQPQAPPVSAADGSNLEVVERGGSPQPTLDILQGAAGLQKQSEAVQQPAANPGQLQPNAGSAALPNGR